MTVECSRIDERAEELALGLVDEPERGELLRHVDGCPRCRALLDDLAMTADQVLLLVPEAEPPAGFEARAVASMGPASADVEERASRRRPRLVAAAATAAALGGILARNSTSPDARAAALDRVGIDRVAAAPLRSPSGERVGDAIVLEGARPSLWMSLDEARPGESYRCEVVLADGSRHFVGVWSPRGPGHSWSVELDDSTASARRLVISDVDGSDVATADLS
jgi:hypothetical protein